MASREMTLASNDSVEGPGFEGPGVEDDAANKRVMRLCDVVEDCFFFFETFLGLRFVSFFFLGTVCLLWGGSSGSGGVTLNTGTELSPPGHICLVKQWLLPISCSM